jgi:aromatic-L-amino-acid/L-tryptophan decarboxylase
VADEPGGDGTRTRGPGLAAEGHLQDSASTSTLVALVAAREATGLGVRDHGLAGRDLPSFRLYCSTEAHSSVEKAALTIGLGRVSVSRIATNERFEMRAEDLEAAIDTDLSSGARPFCIVATAGTTSTTSVDPIERIASVAQKYGLWLHVDAAYAGAAALLPEKRDLFRGWEAADSIVINPHKWLFVPLDCSALLLRDPAATRRAFSLVPDYLSSPEGQTVTNLMDYGPALGRRFRALKLWMTIRHFGRAGLTERIGRHIALARDFASWVEAEPSWSVEAPVPFSTICFRFTPAGLSPEQLDAINEQILERTNETGSVFLSSTRLKGRFVLRLAIGNLRTELKDVETAWRVLIEAAAALRVIRD